MNKLLIKKAALGVAGLLAALLMGGLFAGFISAPSAGAFIWTLAGAALFLGIFLIQTFVGGKHWITPVFLIVESLGAGLFLLDKISPVFLVGLLVMIALLVSSFYTGQAELENSLDIHFSRISRIVMVYATLGLAIFISFAYVASFDLKDPAAAKSSLAAVVKPIEPMVSGYIPKFSAMDTITQLAGKLLPEELRSAPLEQRNLAITEVSSRLSETFGKLTGVPVSGKDRIIDLIYKATFGRLLGLKPIFQTLSLVAVGIIFFFLIKFLFFFVDWAAVGLAFLIFKALEAGGFFRIELRDQPKKVIVLE